MRRHRHIKDPVPVAPFLAWFDDQVARSRRELNAWPGIGGQLQTGVDGPLSGVGYVLVRIGWEADAAGDAHRVAGDAGERRVNRWRTLLGGAVDRAIVEDALWRAGYAFEDVYKCAGSEAGSNAAPAALGVAGPGTRDLRLAS